MDQKKLEQSIADTTDLVELHDTSCSELVETDDSPLSGLTAMELRYVEAFAALAGTHGAMTNAARYAGYSPKTCTVKGSQMIRKPKILAALRYLTEHKAHASAIMAMTTLQHLAMNGNDSIRLKASERILGYSGIIVQTIHRHEHMIQDNRTPEQVKIAISEKAQKLGLDVKSMIDITPHPNKVNPPNPDGAPKYKRQLVPNRELTDDEIEEIDWARMEVNK